MPPRRGSEAPWESICAAGEPQPPVTAIATMWGTSGVLDSPQSDSGGSELPDREYVGTQLATRTGMGLLLTRMSLGLVFEPLERVGGRRAFALLVPGPAFCIWAMRQLARSSAAAKPAGGNG